MFEFCQFSAPMLGVAACLIQQYLCHDEACSVGRHKTINYCKDMSIINSETDLAYDFSRLREVKTG